MKTTGYTNPIRSMERKLAPDYAQREFHNPGIRSLPKGSAQTGLGSLRHTMPHLRRLTAGALHFQTGGSMNPVAQIYAASRPNLYNPDPHYRQILAALSKPRMVNPDLMHLPTAQFAYQEGGEVEQMPPEMPPGMPPDQGEPAPQP